MTGQLAYRLPEIAAAAGVVILAVLGLLRLARPGRRGRDGSEAAHAAIARRCRDADVALAGYGHVLEWAFPEAGGLYGTCRGCPGTVEIIPGHGFIDTVYAECLATGAGELLPCAGQMEAAR